MTLKSVYVGKDFDEIAAAREIVKILCSGQRGVGANARGLAEALESVPPKKLQLMLNLMREKDDGTE